MIVALPRTVLKVSGEGVGEWLDGLLTNRTRADAPTFAALLTPQGKIIADLFVTPAEGGVFIDTPEAMGAELAKRLKMYTLRAPITVEDVSDAMTVHQLFGPDMDEAELPDGAYPDPRHPSLGYRLITDTTVASDPLDAWDAHRLSLGVPDSQFDFGSVQVFPADADMDELNGVDFKKGCFVGQEVVSRMHRLTTAKKRMRSVVVPDGASAGDPLVTGTRRVGELLHVNGNMAMALLRLDRLASASEAVTVNGEPAEVMGGPNG